jgi:hypothetical protein
MRRILAISLSIVCLCTSFAFAKTKPLQIYFIDVEGGQSTLLVSPSGESLLIDAGWSGEANSDKIVAVAKAASGRSTTSGARTTTPTTLAEFLLWPRKFPSAHS